MSTDGTATSGPHTGKPGLPGPSRPEPSVGEYHGRPTRRLASEHLWVEVLATAGPRIVRLGLTDSDENLLAETPDVGWETPNGRYELFGGHRLWFAPEDPDRVAVPDADGVDLEIEPDGIRMTGSVEPITGLIRSISLRLDPTAAVIELRHELCNVGERPLELSPWAITQLPLGGVVMLPQPVAKDGHHVRPNRSLVLWPYTSWEDERLDIRDGLILVRAEVGRRLKLGYFNEAGWVGYLRNDVLLVRRFEPAVGRRHPDLGCNVETYCRDRFLELELLGPLAEIAPGTSVVSVERWQVLRVETNDDPAAVGPTAAGPGEPGGQPGGSEPLEAGVRRALALVTSGAGDPGPAGASS